MILLGNCAHVLNTIDLPTGILPRIILRKSPRLAKGARSPSMSVAYTWTTLYISGWQKWLDEYIACTLSESTVNLVIQTYLLTYFSLQGFTIPNEHMDVWGAPYLSMFSPRLLRFKGPRYIFHNRVCLGKTTPRYYLCTKPWVFTPLP